MKNKYLHVLSALLGLLVLSSCEPEDVQSTDNYKGDGNITFVKSSGWPSADGWLIKFNNFSLSNEYSKTYSFTGLPRVQNMRNYKAYLLIPPSVKKSAFDEVQLSVALFANDKQISTFSAPMKEWDCVEISGRKNQSQTGDGREKRYCKNINIPADPSVEYKLEVHYSPLDLIDTSEAGYFFLLMGTGK